MSEYTPTTDEIREYIETGGEPRPWVELDEAEKAREKARVAAFDRWLAAHDSEVRARALVQGFREGVDFIDDQPGPWGAAVVAGRAEAARRVAAAGGAR